MTSVFQSIKGVYTKSWVCLMICFWQMIETLEHQDVE